MVQAHGTASALPTQAAPGPRPPGLPVGKGILWSVLAAAAIALGEVNRLLAGAIGADGTSRTASGLFGPSAWASRDAWQVWQSGPFADLAVRFLLLHLVVDAVMVMAYAWLLLRLFLPRSQVAVVATLVLVGLEGLEGALGAVGALLLRAGADGGSGAAVPGVLVTGLALVSTAKWLVVAFLLVVTVRVRVVRDHLRDVLLAAARALYHQRLSVVVVILLAALSLLPLSGVFDQLPDVQRRWTDGDLLSTVHFGVAVAVTLLLAVQLFVLGRQRSERAWTNHVQRSAPKQGPPSLWWLSGPAVALAVAGALGLAGHGDKVDPRPLLTFAAVPAALWALSWGVLLALPFLRRRGWARRFVEWAEWTVPAPAVPDERRALAAWRAGDVLAVSVLTVAALGLVRSLTVPVVLGPARLDGSGAGAAATDRWALQLALLAGGIALTVAAFPLSARLLRRLDGAPSSRGGGAVRGLLQPVTSTSLGWGRVGAGMWCAAVVVIVLQALWPLSMSRWAGVVGTIALSLGAWSIVIGFLQVHMQRRQPLEVFRLLRLGATPVVTIALLLPYLNSRGGGDPELHAVRALPEPPPAAAAAAVPGMEQALAQWVARSGACDRPVRGVAGAEPVTARPLLLVAADGGGIRAATWTVAALRTLSGAGDCGRSAVLMSSGVSGGSVGLALSRGADPQGDVERLAGPQALAAALGGLFVGDLVAGATGLRLPALDAPAVDGRAPWLDRAGLIETVWEAEAGHLRSPFTPGQEGAAGAILFNSSAVGVGCRALVGQVDTGPAAGAAVAGPAYGDGLTPPTTGTAVRGDPPCRALTGLPAATFDLEKSYGRCLPPLAWSTAAMLSARFPTVTPAGRVQECGDLGPLQLVDGGYVESSGTGLLAETAPRLMAAVREHNARAATAGGPVLVPVVVFLRNGTGADIVAPPSALSTELLVPVAGLGAGDLQVSTGTWLQRASDAIADPCGSVAPAGQARGRCLAAVTDVRAELPGGVVVVAPATEPAVEAPLGWTLSALSRARLRNAMEAERTCATPRERDETPEWAGGYARLCSLLTTLDPR